MYSSRDLREAKAKKGNVCGLTPSRVNDLANSMGTWRDFLNVDREHTEKDNLNGSSCCIPVNVQAGRNLLDNLTVATRDS